MEVILLESVKKLGHMGQVLRVKPGFARNFLIPQAKALVANADNRAYFESQRAELEAQMAQRLQEAQKRAEALGDLAITIAARAGEQGKLFGSITAHDIASAVVAQSGHTLTKQEVRLEEGPLRQLGQFTVDIHLHSEVTVPLTVNIVAE